VTFTVKYLLADVGNVDKQGNQMTYINYGKATPLAGAYPFVSTDRPVRSLYRTSYRISDEVGKGQEVLRQFPAITLTSSNGAGTDRVFIGIPDVDIRITNIALVGEGLAATTVDVIAAVGATTAVGSTNRLMSALTATELVDDKVVSATLTGNANRVRAGQPIQLVLTDTGSAAGVVAVVVSYILADEGYGSVLPVTYKL